MNYNQYVQQNLLDPLGFKASKLYGSMDLVPNRASGYVVDGNSYRLPEAHNVEIAGAAGGLFATAEELAQWLPRLMEGAVLNQQSVEAFLAPHIATGSPEGAFAHYGYGIGIGKLMGQTAITHGGSINGFNASMLYFPTSKLSMVVLSNLNGGHSETLLVDLIRAQSGAPYALPKARTFIQVEEAVLQSWTGKYRVQEMDLDLDLFVQQGKLQVTIPGQGTFSLQPEATDRYYLAALDTTFVFGQKAGEHTITISAGGDDLQAIKIRP